MSKPNVKTVHGAYSADSISVSSCEHGSIWIRLHDRAGGVFAFGCIDKGTAMALGVEIDSAITGQRGFRCDSYH